MKNKDFVFICKKCGHFVFTKKPVKLLGYECPECGEGPYENWILERMGDYDYEYEIINVNTNT